ncbi:MAG: beta family protein [Sulfuricella sp.]|nr:beta family protein [Sulfuricella sp.]
MAPKYLPILKAKPGELKALANSKTSVSAKVLPLFDVGRLSERTRQAKRFSETSTVTCAYLDEVAESIAKVRKGSSALVDAYQWPPNSATETGEHVIPYIYGKLASLGVKAIPVIGYDRWDSTQYRAAMMQLELSPEDYYCLRLDSHAIEDAAEPEFFEEQLTTILDDLQIDPSRCAVLLDFGDISHASIEDILDQGAKIVEQLDSFGFRRIATAGCSLPPTIDGAVKKPNSTGKVLRKEMLVWQMLRTQYPHINWLFGDYGVRSPNIGEDVVSPHTNGKIRHTIDKHFFIVRGHSVQIGAKGGQMYDLAKRLVESQHYLGPEFSWGDSQILQCSLGQGTPGNSTTWIAIDTNHHIAYAVAEVMEFEKSVTAVSAETI